ncbi:hypothetical protein [Paenibacillus sp. P22]|uniref:hypothetical protein n=1 Tax=Paenibacillus sp. P22 TaxID=483908 RepID=UPI0004107057|nr:hypothetical protein [Paenibacillus sp. P22]CDN41135.1 BH2649 protein [Paenibacillus sp. P22]
MKTYLKLVHLEIYRFRLVLLGLMAMTSAIQLIGLQLAMRDRLQAIRGQLTREGLSLAQYAERYNGIPLGEIWSHRESWMTFPIVICIGGIGLYIFLIWYRDWFGRSAFVYRLLMLPHSRFLLYVSKFTALMTFVFSLFALQIGIVAVQMTMYRLRMPDELRVPRTLVDTIRGMDLVLFIPVRLHEFLLVYGFGSVFVLLLFTTILMERSYRFKGLLAGLAYTAGTLMLVAWMWGQAERGTALLYPSELLAAAIALMLLNAALSLWLGRWLLRTKVAA